MKRILTLITLLAIVTPAFAQQPEVNLKISNDDVNTIGKALGKLPFDEVAGLIQKLREQIIAQQPKPAEAAPAPAVPAK